jgi:hypothetical protein
MKDTSLEPVFLATTYRVVTPAGTFNLRIGKPDAAFELFLRRMRALNWGVITACNSGGVLASDPKANDAATRKLAARIRALGWLGFPSINRADSADWPDEPGYCVLDAGENALYRLAEELGQAAIVYGEAEAGGCGGRLIWIEAPTDSLT